MLDDLFQADNLKAARDAAIRPPPVPKQSPSFSAWSTITAAPRGVTTGAAQSGGFFADVIGAFGEMSVASGMGDPMLASRDKQVQAAEKIQREGLDFTTGDPLREFGRQFQPDPETAHVAERLVFDLSRFVTKAVGYTAAAGPLAGASLTGADEALATSDELRRQGVDLGTRSAVGAVVGAVSALGVGLPMAGRTALQTTGLVAAGGPLSFMGQQAAVRKILQDADYTKLGEQYDPFDPVGLAISTLVPAAFGVHGLRVNQRAAAARAAEEFRTGPVPSQETATATAAREATLRPSEEHVDAARTLLEVENRRQSNPARVDDNQAAQAHETALAKAEEQIAAGERVSVADVAPSLASAVAPPPIERVQVAIVKRPGMDAVDVNKTLSELPPVPDGHIRLFRGESPTVKFSDVFDVSQLTGERAVGIPGARYTPDLKYADYYRSSYGRDATVHYIDVPNEVAASGKVNDYEYKIDLNRVNQLRAQSSSTLAEFSARVNEAASLVKAEIDAQQNAPAPAPAARPTSEATTQPQAADAASPAAPRQAEAGAPAAGSAAPKAGLVDDGAAMRVAEIEAAQPDMLVQLDGMDAPKPLSEVMAAVKAEADDLIADGDLMQQAAVCALLNGQ